MGETSVEYAERIKRNKKKADQFERENKVSSLHRKVIMDCGEMISEVL